MQQINISTSFLRTFLVKLLHREYGIPMQNYMRILRCYTPYKLE